MELAGGPVPRWQLYDSIRSEEENMATTQASATEIAAKLRPLGDRVVVQPSSREETTRSGIVIPDTAKEKPQRGTVVAVGEGRRDEDGNRIPMDVAAGNEVLFAKYSGTEFKLEDEDLLILSEKDILAIVQG
jgi:chaperonin GroES